MNIKIKLMQQLTDKWYKKSRLFPIILIVVFSLVGSLIIINSLASPQNTVSIEAEAGDISICGTERQSDASASGGQRIRFSLVNSNEDCRNGTTYYVDCSQGLDSNNGTSPTSAVRSLSRASNINLLPGDSLLLRRECSFTGQLNLSRSGTAANDILIGAYGSGTALPIISRNTLGEIIILRGSHITIRDIDLRASPYRIEGPGQCQGTAVGYIVGILVTNGATQNTITNIQATGFYAGVFLQSGAINNRVLDSSFTNNNMMNPLDTSNPDNDAGAFGILIWGDDNIISKNTISGSYTCSYDYGHDGGAVEVYGGQRNIISHNTSIQNDAFVELGNSRTRDNVLAYNVVTSTHPGSIFLVTRGGGDNFGPVTNTRAYNNTAYLTGAQSQGLVCFSSCNSNIMTARNNIMWANKGIFTDANAIESNNIYWNASGSPQMQKFGGILGTGSRVTNPLFITNGTNLRIQIQSPARNTGSNESVNAGFNLDFLDTTVPRGSQVDIGAYEFIE